MSTEPENTEKFYEFDREPVPQNKLLGPFYYLSLYAGEHIAATEFVIGALFVSWGAGVRDIFLGLLIGNLLAVLSWTLVCAPIAVDTRLTLYWYVNRVGGTGLAFFYNVINGVLYCMLAGTMITVSASAIRPIFGIPAQVLWYPTDLRFDLLVVFIGVVTIILAVLGLKKVAQFNAVCSPWMILMFLAGGLVALPLLGAATGIGPIRTIAQFREMAATAVWTGVSPEGSTEHIGFWHVVGFAWICNLGMHIGLSDMAAFRFAQKARYGLCTSTGMFLGHYFAWIFAGLMGAGAALALKTPLTKIDSGDVGNVLLGVSGSIAVLLSGWTTAMPTLYKAGLALQAASPNWARWKITWVAGVITTVIACFPFVFAQMLRFVALYGLMLMPIGAIVFTEHWIFPKLGLTRFWAHHKGLRLNWPALVTWIAGIVFALGMWYADILHLFFLFIPVYFITVILYIGLAILAGAREQVSMEAHHAANPSVPNEVITPTPDSRPKPSPIRSGRRKVSGLVSLISLIACAALPLWMSFQYGADYHTRLPLFKILLLVASLIYLVAGTIWLIEKEKPQSQQ
jgi:cytosine permease